MACRFWCILHYSSSPYNSNFMRIDLMLVKFARFRISRLMIRSCKWDSLYGAMIQYEIFLIFLCDRFSSIKERREDHCVVHFCFVDRRMLCLFRTLLLSIFSPCLALLIRSRFLCPENHLGRLCYQGIWRYQHFQTMWHLWWWFVQGSWHLVQVDKAL